MTIPRFLRSCSAIALLVACAACGGSGGAPTSPSAEPSPVIYDVGDASVTLPTLLKEVKPSYPAAALSRRIQGVVLLGAVVRADGAITDVVVLGSIDRVYGLDDAAVAAARLWQFSSPTRNGQPVALRITIEMTFSIRE